MLRVYALLILTTFSAMAQGPTNLSAPVPVGEAAGRMQVPPGFNVTLFAGEPDVVQPIAMTLDERGRLWVVECLSYPTWTANASGRDRVIIFTDNDGDGKFDQRRVFWDQGRNLTGIALGMGGVWLCSTPELIFVPDRNRDDTADGPPEVMLDGWDLGAKHNAFNGLTWGPDGWLYGCNGILSNSKVGVPGAAANDRVSLNCGVWRFHPVTRKFEVVMHGTTNPWGIAFNETGQMFIVNCVIKHLFHAIPGGRYERMFGQDNNQYAFRLMPSCADHIHWAGGFWKTEGAEHSQNDLVGGGHAHSGAMIYQGDNWPELWRHQFFTCNVHGHRINGDKLEPQGSGYVAKHAADFMRAPDAWFRGVGLMYGPDGGVFVSDWSDAGECHDYEDIHRENGRIYKITYGRTKHWQGNLNELSDGALIELQRHANEWQASQARRQLQERALGKRLDPGTGRRLAGEVRSDRSLNHRLRLLWALQVTGQLDQPLVRVLLNDSAAWIRAWTIQFALENVATWQPAPAAGARAEIPEWLASKLVSMARDDKSAVVRLYLASALQRIPLSGRSAIGRELAAHAEDANDVNLPLMIWYGIEPILAAEPEAGSELLMRAKIPLLRQHIAQRLALAQTLDPVVKAIERTRDASIQSDALRGLYEALNGRRNVAMPARWRQASVKLAAHRNSETRDLAQLLSVIFGDAMAADQLRQRILNPGVPRSVRAQALQTLVQTRARGVVPLLHTLLVESGLRREALRGLAAFDEPETPGRILGVYERLEAAERTEAIGTLASRPAFGRELLQAVENGKVSRKDLSPFVVRQIQALKDEEINRTLKRVLGDVRPISEDKAARIQQLKSWLTPEALRSADRRAGRELFSRTCAGCHTLFGEGGNLAPELTGSQRNDLDYLLENVVDPNMVVWNQYRTVYFETADERLISGVVLKENESTVTIQTLTGTVTLPVRDIRLRTQSALSIMPEGLLDGLERKELVDLIAYLQGSIQVALPGN